VALEAIAVILAARVLPVRFDGREAGFLAVVRFGPDFFPAGFRAADFRAAGFRAALRAGFFAVFLLPAADFLVALVLRVAFRAIVAS
jgi:hypothetical protein